MHLCGGGGGLFWGREGVFPHEGGVVEVKKKRKVVDYLGGGGGGSMLREESCFPP